MLNLVVEKRLRKDRDQSGLSIIRPRMGTPTGFVQRSRLDFGLGTSPCTVDMCFLFLLFFIFILFYFIVVALTSAPRASLTLTLAVHLSIAIAIYFLIFPSYYLHFHLH